MYSNMCGIDFPCLGYEKCSHCTSERIGGIVTRCRYLTGWLKCTNKSAQLEAVEAAMKGLNSEHTETT